MWLLKAIGALGSPEIFLDSCGAVASSFWSNRFMAHQPEICLSVLATVVITWEECGLASAPTPKLNSIIILF